MKSNPYLTKEHCMPRNNLLYTLDMKTPELLLPVANMEMCQAAVHNGANAIYVGMPGFNARGRALELSFQELKEMIDFCHLYLVKVHVAFNILIFQNELTKAKDA